MQCTRQRIAAAAATAALVVLVGAASADAARKKVQYRHHADPVRALRSASSGARAIPALPATWCGVEQTTDVASPLSNAPKIKVIYAYGLGAADNFNAYKDKIQGDVNLIRQKVDTESGGTKSIRFDLGNVAPGGGCGGNLAKQYADIQVVQLPKSVATYNGTPATLFTTLKTDILAAAGAGATGSRTDYVVYADGIHKAAGIAGEASSAIDDSPGYGNATNSGGLVAVIYGFGTAEFNQPNAAGVRQASFLHELSHTQGVVQDSAPNSSRGGHCFDEKDIMCYNDGGPYFTGGGALTFPAACAGGVLDDISEALDCNKDDYFNASPAAGSYLATHWNAYTSVFLCASTGASSCDSTIAPPAVTLSAPASALRGNTLSLTANATGAAIEHFEWDLDNDGRFERDTGTSNTTSQQLTSNGTKTVNVRASAADGTFAADTKSVTVSEPTTPTPAFTITSGAAVVNKPVTFDASFTTDPSGVISAYKWDFDGNGTIDLDAGLAKTATTTYTTAGARLVTLQVDYPLGLSTRSALLTVGTGATTPPVIGPSLAATIAKLAKLLRSGLRLKITCGAACAATAKLTVSAATAKKLKLKGKRGKPVTIGTLKRTVPSPGILTTQIVLTGAARRALAKAKSVPMTFTAQVTQPGFAPLKVKRALKIKR